VGSGESVRVIRTQGYLADVRRFLPNDQVWKERLNRRESAIEKDPEHHGYHLSRRNHCKWAVPVERFYIIYELVKSVEPVEVRLLVFYEP
jgi:hypothetical protein